ncbi:MAG: 50S ribosomal protein L21 [Caldisericia bacterium]|nr:50S ribosomal protein L21 [Caldisericia bacterium]
MYAVIKTGGKQYKVQENDVIKVEKLDNEPGETFEIKEVTLLEKDGEVKAGSPFVNGATVTAEILRHGKNRKLLIFFYRHKTTYRRRKGHRQQHTELKISSIKLEA